MKNKIYTLITVVLALFCLQIIFDFSTYYFVQKNNKNKFLYCSQNNTQECSTSLFELLLPKLLVHKVEHNNEELIYAKLSSDPVWHPFVSFENTNLFVKYSEPQKYIDNYNLDLYLTNVKNNFKLEVVNLKSDSNYCNELFDVLNKAKANNKKVFLHLNLIQLENNFVDNIFPKYSDIIVGINIFYEINSTKEIAQLYSFFEKINEKFILVSRNSAFLSKEKFDINTKYYKGEIYNSALILSFINSAYIDKHSISLLQDTNKVFTGKKVLNYIPLMKAPLSDVHYVVTLTEMAKQFLNKNNSYN